MKNKKNISKSLQKALLKALTTEAGSGGDFLPAPLADEFISYIYEKNFLRQAFRTVPMETKTRTYPKILGGSKVYHQPTEGGTAIKHNLSTGSLVLTAKKFMSEIDMTQEEYEDAKYDMENIIRENFGGGVAEAEESAMVAGNPDHTPVTATEASADETTWFNRDSRLIFYGLLTLAGDVAGSIANDTRAGNRVDAEGAAMTPAMLAEAIHNMGKYGRNFADVVGIVNPWSKYNLLNNSNLMTIDKYGQNATILTGEFGKLYGKASLIESPYCTDTYGVVTHKGNPIIGDRRMISIKKDEIIREDLLAYVLTERLDFTVMYKGALVQIYRLEAASDVS